MSQLSSVVSRSKLQEVLADFPELLCLFRLVDFIGLAEAFQQILVRLSFGFSNG